jgi:Ca2+/Na+ antiporter
MIYEVISGALMACCVVAGLFFLKFWRKTHDQLFIMFSFSFFLLAIERLVLGYLGSRNEPSPLVYLIRLGAFILIIFAIINKNKETSSAENS